ncbi:hypothetical protein CYY_009228 [Polysphondylium violaceum]|uniref:SAC3/GANP/THP3 conserved domain-containing protein n=1 Tax=Polysphondylium violaceum TaxID=133409 RepID=A0A8J4PMD5_9MYCE|nr:hypothetical protein CYY_009228 [Polysphondylium violaceum]
MGFCPEKEITFRTNSGDINKLERTADGTIVLLKKYKRNVADDYTEIPPDEIRPPPICLKVMDYMTHSVADQQNIPFSEIQNFIRDRTRSLRQDLTSQHAKDDISINIHERCTRFHIVSHHYLCELPDKDFNQFQNREQLNNCLTSLKQFYDDHKRRTGLISKNEPEFRSYYILNSLENNSDLVSYMISIPQEIFYHPFIQYAIEVWKAYRSSNYCRFFILAAKGTFLQACILHRYFIHVRKMAVKYMNKAYRAGKNAITMYPIADFQSLLMFYDIAETMDFIEQYRFSVDSDQVVFPQDLPEVSITPRRSQIILNRAPPTFQLSIDQPESVPLADYKSVFIQFKSNYNDASLYSKENFKSIESYMRQLQKNPLANQNFLKRVDKNNGSVVLSPKPVLPKPSPISKTTAIPTVLPPTTTTTTTTTLATTPIALNKNVPVIQSNPSIPPLPTTTTSTAIPFKDTTATTTTVAAATKVDAPISPFGLVKPPTLSNTVSTTSASSIFKNPTPVKETTTPSSIFGPQSTTTSPTPGTSLFGNSSNIASPFKAQEPEPKVESVFGPKVPASSTTTINNPTSVFANNAVASKIFPSFAAQPPSSSTLSPLTTTTTTTTTIATPTTTISSPPPSLTTTQPPSIGSIFNSSVIDKPTLNQFIQPTTPHTTLKDKASKSEFKTPYQKKPEKNVVPQSPMEFSTLKAPKVGGDLPLPSMDFSVIKPPTTAPVAASPMSISTPYIGNKNNKNDDSIFKTPSVSATSPMELSTIYKQPNRKPRDKLPFPIEDINKAKNTPEPVIPPTPQPPPKIQKTYQEKSDISLLRYLFRVWRVKNMVYNQQKDQIEKMKKELNSGIEKTLSHSSNKKINYSKTPDIAVVPTLSPIESLAATTQHVDTDTITPINIPYYIYNNINNNNKNHKHLYWKLVYNTCTDSTESQIITKQLSFKPPLTTSKYPSTSYLSNSQQLGIKYKDGDDKKSDKPISISIVKTTTINSSNSSSTRGISSLLFHSNYFESNDQSQLLSILKVLDVEQNYQRIPVVFIVKQSSAEKIDSFIYDNQSLWKRIVNAFKIIEFNYNSSNNIIQEILDWSSQHSISLPTIVEIRPISSVLESILQAKLNYIFKAHYQWPRIDYTEHQIDINTIYPTPQSLIDYFNSTIKQLSQYITDPSLESIQWPIGEFLNSFDYWNTKENFKNLQLALNSILIPNLPLSISNLIGCLFSNNNNNSSSNSNNNQNNNVNYKDYQSIQVIIESLFNWVSTTLTKDDSIIIISELKIILQEFNDNYCKNQYYFRTIPLPWHLILGSIFSFQISKIPLLKSLFDSQLILDLPNFNNNNNIGTIAKIQIDLPIIPSISPISKKRDSPLPKYSKYESNTKALKFEDLNTTSMDIKYNNNNNNNNNNSNNNNRLTAPLGTFNETLKSNSIHGTSTSRSILSSQIKLSKSLIQNNKTTDQLLDKFLKSLEQEKAKSSQQHQFSSLTNTINHHNYNNFTPSSKQQYQQKKNNIDQLFLDIENEKEKANQLDISLSMLQ